MLKLAPVVMVLAACHGDKPVTPPDAGMDAGMCPSVELPTGPACTGRIAYRPRAWQPGGYSPSSISTGDLNHDGKVDAIVTNRDSNSITVYLGRANGDFADPATYPVGDGPVATLLDDVDTDGHLDVLVLEDLAGTVTVLRNDGTGALTSQATYPIGSPTVEVGVSLQARWHALALGDLDGNGSRDLVVAGGTSPNVGVAVLLGNGSGGFAAKVEYPIAGNEQPFGIVLADLDGDGKLDVLETVRSGYAVFKGNGNGTLGAPTITPASVRTPWLVDVTGDGKRDLIGSSGNVFPGLAGGGFGAAVAVAPQGIFELADFDHDGTLDVLTATDPYLDWQTAKVLLGTGTGTFTEVPARMRGSPPFAAVDVDADGNTDMLGTFGVSLLTLSTGRGDGTFDTQALVADTSTQLTSAADLDHDGLTDLVLVDAVAQTASVLIGTGDARFAVAQTFLVGDAAGYSQLVDLDGDCDLDLVTSNARSPGLYASGSPSPIAVATFLHGGDGTFTPAGTVDIAPGGGASFLAADLDGDHKPELVITRDTDSQGELSIYPGGGDGTFGAPLVLAVGRGPRPAVLADLDNNGRLDLIVLHVVTANTMYPPMAQFTAFLQGQDGSFAAVTAAPFPYKFEPGIPVVGDIDGDGILDVAGAPGGYYKGHGDGSFSFVAGFVDDVPELVDLNADGLLDQVTSSSIRFGQGDGTFSDRVPTPAQVLKIVDVNADGSPDLVLVDGVTLNNGDGTFGRRTFTALGEPSSLSAVRLNGDALVDLIDRTSGRIYLHVATCLP